MKTINSFCTNKMEVELQLCHLFLLYAFWGLRTSNGNFCTCGSASPKFHHKNWGRNKCSPFSSLLLFIRCKFEVTVYLFKFMYCLFITCSILKKKKKKNWQGQWIFWELINHWLHHPSMKRFSSIFKNTYINKRCLQWDNPKGSCISWKRSHWGPKYWYK